MTDATPTAANRTLRRQPNAVYRPREYLTEAEVERLIRAQELCSLRWSQIDLRHADCMLIERRAGIESVHPLHGPTPTTTAWFLRMIQRTGVAARLPFAVHPHMLRHI